MLQKSINALNVLDLTHRKVQNVLRAKCIIVGDPAVGKSSLTQAFSNESNNFQKNYSVTCGVDIRTKKVSVPDTDDVVEMFLYDSSGKDVYLDMLMQLWQQPSMVCLLFDVTNKNSFNQCSDWLDGVNLVANKLTLPGVLIGCKTDLVNRRTVLADAASEFAKKNGVLIGCKTDLVNRRTVSADAASEFAKKNGVLIGCKTDLVNRRTVSADAASEFAKKNGLCYFECSVKENTGVEEPFFYLVNEWHKLYLEKTEFFKTIS